MPPTCSHPAHFAGLFLLNDLTVARCVQVAKNKADLEQDIVTLSQFYVINVQRLHDLDDLAVRWDTSNIHSIHQHECEGIIAEIEMLQKMGGCVRWGGIPLNNLEFKTWLHLKMLIDSEMPLINSSHPPVDCFGCTILMVLFSIRRPHPDDLHIVCCLIERRLLPDTYWVIARHHNMFVMHNVAHQKCKIHLDNISALLLLNHLKLASLKEDNIDLILG